MIDQQVADKLKSNNHDGTTKGKEQSYEKPTSEW